MNLAEWLPGKYKDGGVSSPQINSCARSAMDINSTGNYSLSEMIAMFAYMACLEHPKLREARIDQHAVSPGW